MLANVYLHYVLDQWFEEQVRPRLKGESHIVRYADDFHLHVCIGGRREAFSRGTRETLREILVRASSG